MKKQAKKQKTIKGWGVICDTAKIKGAFAFGEKGYAKERATFLNKEYKGYCKHKVVPVKITKENV